jgi:DNA-binding beta-propeller fold protein YncE
MTHKLYVVNWGNVANNGTLTVIDGNNSFAAQTITLGTKAYPYDAAVNETTNKVYVSLSAFNSMLVIDGADNSTQTVPVGENPNTVAVNEKSNKIYVANVSPDDRSTAGYTVTEIDGATLETVSFADANGPEQLALNTVTDKIYVTNFDDGTVTVIALTPQASLTVAGTAIDDTVILQIDNKTPSVNDRSWTIGLTVGTLKGDDGADLTGDVTLPTARGVVIYSEKYDTNKILITLRDGDNAPDS